MCADINEQLIGAKKRLEQQRSAKHKSVQMQDQLKQQTYKMQYAELAIEELKQHINTLESLTLTSLFSTLTGTKNEKLKEAQDRLRIAEQEFADHARTVTKLQSEFQRFTTIADNADDAGTQYDQLLQQKQKVLLDGDDGPAAELKRVVDQSASLKEQLRLLNRCLETGRELLNSISSLNKAVDRARNRNINSRGTMGLGSLYNHAQQKSTTPVVTRARDGIEKLRQCIDQLDLSAGTPNDLEVAEKAPNLEPLVVELHDGWIHSVVDSYTATHGIEDCVRSVLNAIDDKREEVEKQAGQTEKQRRQIIETA